MVHNIVQLRSANDDFVRGNIRAVNATAHARRTTAVAANLDEFDNVDDLLDWLIYKQRQGRPKWSSYQA